MSIEGGYRCGTFERPREGEEAVTLLRGRATNTPTLVARGAALTRDVVVEGVTVLGRDTERNDAENDLDSVAIAVRESATLTLRNLVARGGVANARSVGVEIVSAAPYVHHSRIEGGRSRLLSLSRPDLPTFLRPPLGHTGSIGLFSNTSGVGARLEDNVIQGGGADTQDDATRFSAVGVLLFGGRYVEDLANPTSTSALLRNTIVANPDDEIPANSAALLTAEAELDLLESFVGLGALRRLQNFPVMMEDGGVTRVNTFNDTMYLLRSKVRVLRSRVLGPELQEGDSSIADTFAIISNQGDLTIENSLVSLGTIVSPHDAVRGVSFTGGNSTKLRIANSTFDGGGDLNEGPPHPLLLQIVGLSTQGEFATVEILHNLFVARTNTERSFAMAAVPARPTSLKVRGNVFVGTRYLGTYPSGTTNDGSPVVTAHTELTAFEKGFKEISSVPNPANNNVHLTPQACEVDVAQCESCGQTCGISVLDDYAEPSRLRAQMQLGGAGLPLVAGVSCLVAARPNCPTTTDIDGNPRATTTCSAGAHEYRDSTPCGAR